MPLRNVLAEGARRFGLEQIVEVAEVFTGWRELVGDQVAARCEPASLSHGVLKVRAASAAWAHELRYLAPEVLRRVNAGVGSPDRPVVKELKVVVGPPGAAPATAAFRAGEAPRPPRGGGKVRGPALAPAGRGLEPDELVAGIADERLAAATKRALLAAKTHSLNP